MCFASVVCCDGGRVREHAAHQTQCCGWNLCVVLFVLLCFVRCVLLRCCCFVLWVLCCVDCFWVVNNKREWIECLLMHDRTFCWRQTSLHTRDTHRHTRQHTAQNNHKDNKRTNNDKQIQKTKTKPQNKTNTTNKTTNNTHTTHRFFVRDILWKHRQDYQTQNRPIYQNLPFSSFCACALHNTHRMRNKPFLK